MAIIKFWTRIFDFGGTSSRSEFWLGSLVNGFILGVILAFISDIATDLVLVIMAIVLLAYALATISARVRRLRDSGRGWGWIFIQFVPLVGGLVLFILLLMPSEY